MHNKDAFLASLWKLLERHGLANGPVAIVTQECNHAPGDEDGNHTISVFTNVHSPDMQIRFLELGIESIRDADKSEYLDGATLTVTPVNQRHIH